MSSYYTIETPSSLENKKRKMFFDVAMNIAKECPMKRCKHGAVLVKNNEIIAKGYNYSYNNKETLHNHYAVHAEVNVILQAKSKGIKNLSETDLYVVRISNDNDNELMLSKPCKNCSKLILKYKVRRVYYSLGNSS